MEFRELRYFVAVAEELHFGRAAVRAGIAQPPLSQSIRRLEARLGVALFVRSSRRVALTPAGEALLGHARTLLAGREEAKVAVRRVGAGEAGELKIGFGASSAIGLLPDIVRAYRAERPGVTLRLIEFAAIDVELEVIAGGFDLAMIRGPLLSARLAVEPLADEPLLLALASDHPRAELEPLLLADLADQPFILFPRASAPVLHDTIIAACAEAGFSPEVVQEASSWAAVASLVGAGIGITLVPAFAQYLPLPSLRFRALADVSGRAQLAAAWPKGELAPAAAAFLVIAREILACASAGPK